MLDDLDISRVTGLPADLDALLQRSLREGFGFLQRLRDDWSSGSNRFEEPGEALFVARHRGSLVGICGLNRDPWSPGSDTGRLRRLYVAPTLRGQGIGRRLVEAALSHARGRFQRLRVRTDSRDADLFYRSLGFSSVRSSEEATHELMLAEKSAV